MTVKIRRISPAVYTMAIGRSAATPHAMMDLAAVTAPRRTREGPSRSRHTRGTSPVALNESGRIPLN